MVLWTDCLYQIIFDGIFIGYFIGSSGVLLTMPAMLLAEPLARLLMGYDMELYELTKYAFMLFSFSFLLAGFNIFASGYFTALNNGAVSAAAFVVSTAFVFGKRKQYGYM